MDEADSGGEPGAHPHRRSSHSRTETDMSLMESSRGGDDDLPPSASWIPTSVSGHLPGLGRAEGSRSEEGRGGKEGRGGRGRPRTEDEEDKVDDRVAVAVADPETDIALRLMRVFGFFGAGTSVAEVVYRHGRELASLGVSPRAIVLFGVLHGCLRRLHEYPVPVERDAVPDPSLPRGLEALGDAGQFALRFAAFLDGDHSLDALCCAAQLGRKEVKQLLAVSRYPRFHLVVR